MLRKCDGEKSGTVSRAVLSVLGITGIVAVAVLAPNAVQMFQSFPKPRIRKLRSSAAHLKYNITATIARLERDGCIALERRDGDVYAQLTEKGEKRLDSYQARGFSVQKQQEWDGKWRVVIFDVREEKRSVRDKLRRGLRSFGFVRLQQSVWVLPYDCEDIIAMFKTDQKLWGDVLYMVAERIEGESRLRKLFGLQEKIK